MVCFLSGESANANTSSEQSPSSSQHSREGSPKKANVSVEASSESSFQNGGCEREFPGHDSVQVGSESGEDELDIDQEIESEIRAMDSTLSSKDTERLKAVNQLMAAEPEPESQVTLDWSDVTVKEPKPHRSKIMTKGVLRLQDKNTESKNTDKIEEENDQVQISNAEKWSDSEDQWGEDRWGTPETSPVKAVPIPSLRENDEKPEEFSSQHQHLIGDQKSSGLSSLARKSETRKKEPSTKQNVLGAEFDIKSIRVKKTPDDADPLDFFADMEPVIQASKAQSQGDQASKTKSTISFDMVSPLEQEV